jgi:hypothetical protein
MKKTKKKRASSKTKKRGARKAKKPSMRARASTAKRPGKRTTLASMKPKTLQFHFKTGKQSSAFLKAIKPFLKSMPKLAPREKGSFSGKEMNSMIVVPYHLLKKGFNPAGELRRLAKEHGSTEASTRYS